MVCNDLPRPAARATATAEHCLKLSRGLLHVSITEAPDKLYVAISGVKPRGFERRKFKAFMWPIVDAYRDDPRGFEISSERADSTGHVVPCGRGWLAFELSNEGARHD